MKNLVNIVQQPQQHQPMVNGETMFNNKGGGEVSVVI